MIKFSIMNNMLTKFKYLILFLVIYSCKQTKKEVFVLDKNKHQRCDFKNDSLVENGMFGTFLNFKNKNKIFIGDYVLDNTKDISINFWIKAKDNNSINASLLYLFDTKNNNWKKHGIYIFINKNRIAIIHEGQDLRKINYKMGSDFSKQFLSLKKIAFSQDKFYISYTYNSKIKTSYIYIDSELYCVFNNVMPLGEIDKFLIGNVFNKKGELEKYQLLGGFDNLLITNTVLSQGEIKKLMIQDLISL